MRRGRLLGIACALACGLVSPARAADGEAVLVARGAEYRYSVATVPTVTSSLAMVALAGLDVASGRAHVVPSALGEVQLELGGFPGQELDERGSKRGNAPFAGRGVRACDCRTELVDTRNARAAVLYATTAFEVRAPAAITTVELAVRYRDGLAIYINGKEVVRRNLRAGQLGAAIAARPRGSEWERFYVPVTPGLLREGKNVLAVEVRPSGHSGAPELDLELRGTRDVKLVRGPVVQRPTGDQLVVRFTTNEPAQAALEWGTTEALGRRVLSAGGALARQHRAVISGLPSGKPIYYRVRAQSAVSKVHRVAPAPSPGDTLRFAVYGDMRGGHSVHQQIVSALMRGAPDFVVVTGDLVLRGSDGGDWQRFFSVVADLVSELPYYPVAGNHDMGRSGDERRLVGELFELPRPGERPLWASWYSFDVADLHFVMLDSNAYEESTQLEWLRGDLRKARARGVRAIFAATHEGPYSRGIHRGNRQALEVYLPLLVKGGVAMLFSGHEHMYQRGEAQGLRYVVSGGGGAPLYPIRCGGAGRRRCDMADGAQEVQRAHHFLEVTVRERQFELCARRPDGSPLEPCVTYHLPGH